MSLQSRIDKAEAEARDRARAELHAADEACWEWLRANGTPAEYDAFCRAYFAPFIAAQLQRQAAGESLSEDEQIGLELDKALGPLQPDDRAVADALDARIPPDLAARLKAARESPLLRDE